MTSQLLHANLRLAALGLLVSTSLFAQTAATPPASETVTLSPFSVTTSADRGYNVSESMTGSRVKTQIIDLPYTVNVMTSEFLEDFGLFELADNVTHISGFTGLDVGGNFLLRGFISTNQLRDGFFRLGRYGSSNVDRIEIIKGSSAAIYGRSAAGGMMNTEAILLSAETTLDEALKRLRDHEDLLESTHVLFLTGPDGKVTGAVPLARLFLAEGS
ncbi:MAG: TonB-dependent receptor plug domain-containing protein, partial [Opitutaceae bacterium]